MNAAELAVAELRTQLENQSTRLTEIASEIRGLSLNHVLWSELITIPSSGSLHRDTSTPYASIGLWAYGTDQVTIDSGSEGLGAPAGGIGVIIVPGKAGIVWPLVGTTVSIYGTADQQLLLTLWSKPQAPLIAPSGAAINGGGA